MPEHVNLRFQKKEATSRVKGKRKSGSSRASSSGSNHGPFQSPRDITLKSSESLEISLK